MIGLYQFQITLLLPTPKIFNTAIPAAVIIGNEYGCSLQNVYISVLSMLVVSTITTAGNNANIACFAHSTAEMS